MNLIEFLLTTIYLILAVSLLIFFKWLFLPFPSAIKTIILFNANSVSTPGKKEKIAEKEEKKKEVKKKTKKEKKEEKQTEEKEEIDEQEEKKKKEE